jgi:hypothetical protein
MSDFNNLILHKITLQVNMNCFGQVVSLRDFQRLSPLEQMYECFTVVAPHIFLGDHELNKIDSALYQEALFYGTVVHEKKYLNNPTLFLHFCDYPPLKRTWPFI